MNISPNQVTRHVSLDRADRLAIIGATVGFGSTVLKERYNPAKESWSCFMDSGAMLIWSKNHERLVTGFIPTKTQVMWTYNGPVNKAILKLIENASKKYQKNINKL